MGANENVCKCQKRSFIETGSHMCSGKFLGWIELQTSSSVCLSGHILAPVHKAMFYNTSPACMYKKRREFTKIILSKIPIWNVSRIVWYNVSGITYFTLYLRKRAVEKIMRDSVSFLSLPNQEVIQQTRALKQLCNMWLKLSGISTTLMPHNPGETGDMTIIMTLK